ncbi:MAG: hypothetical protein JRI86_10105 [Deltaproteobacteria bacterium]|jgi:hypothetical protein|nr:hypothetical protein [Deltaproteobacteria bacterium]
MTKEKLIKTLQRLLDTDNNLNFLLKLEASELETLIACLREKIDYK